MNMPNEPDLNKATLYIMDKLPDLTFYSMNVEREVGKMIKRAMEITINATIDRCVQAARAYEPMGFQEWDQVRAGVVENIKSLRTLRRTRSKNTS